MQSVLSPELVSSLWAPSDPQVSPDGQRVAWVAAPYGKAGEHPESGIWVARIGQPSSARRWTHEADDKSPRWSPDGSKLAFLSDRGERGTHGLYVLDIDGGEAAPLVVRARSVELFAWSPDGSRIAFLAPEEPTDEDTRRENERDDVDVFGERWQYHRLWFVAPEGGEAELGWAPERHLTGLAWSPDASRLLVASQQTPLVEDASSTCLSTWVPESAEATLVCSAPGAGSAGWSGPATIVYQAPHEAQPQSSFTVWSVSASGGDPEVVGTGRDEPRCTLGSAHTPDGTGTLLLVGEGLDTRLEWLTPDRAERTVAQDVPGEVTDFSVTIAEGGAVIAAVLLSGGLVGRVVAGPPGELQPLSDHARDAQQERVWLGSVEPLYCNASDGIDLDAVVIRPPDGGSGPWPTAVLLHGGPYGRSGLWAHLHPLDWGQLLATRGYAVVLPNYRGGSGHGNAFATSVRGDMGGAEWRDVLTIVDAAVGAGIADPEHLGIGGWSQGGFLTAWAVTATDRFRLGVMGAGVTDWGMLAATSDMPQFEAALGGDNRWDGPGPHRADAHSPISYAAKRTTPLLILHGAEDERVPLSQVIAFRRALAGQTAPLELVTYPREPHGIRERQHQIDLQQRVVEWFDRYVR